MGFTSVSQYVHLSKYIGESRMSDAPERITVTIDDGSLFLEGEPTDEMIGRFWGHVEYVRADLFAELEARLQPHKAGRTNTAEMARAMYQKQCEYVGPQHEEACVTMLSLAFDSFEDRIAELEVEVERLRNLPPEHEVSSGSFDVCPSCKGEKGHYDATSMKGVWHVCHICHGTGRVRDE